MASRKIELIKLAAVMLFTIARAAWTDEVSDRAKDPNLWAAPAGDQENTRHSRLKDINTTNVSKLQMIWSQSSGTLRGHEGQPLVVTVDGKPMMYMESGWPNIVQALDLTDPDHPQQIWHYNKATDRDESAVARACCDTVNRGLSYADGKLVFATLDGFVIALDAKTGKEDWVVKQAWPDKGETITPAPIIANGKVIIGFGGDEFAARGRLDAYNLADGKKVWEFYSTGSDKDVGLTSNTNKAHPEYGTAGKDIGISSYPGDEWKRGGGAQWGFYSYDPELKLVYTSTGNPGLWSPSYRCGEKTQQECNSGKWDNKWSMSIFARNVDTGEVAWVYQMTPFDQWDYDGINENMLEDLTVDGKMHKVLIHFDRNGFAYVLDRADGTLLRANKYVTTNWAEKVDLKTGRPVKVYEHSPLAVGGNTQACPSAMGGKDQQPCAIDPTEPGMAYCPTNNWCMEDEPQQRSHTQQGSVYVFGNVYMYPEKPGVTGKFKKFNVVTGETVWEIPDAYPNWGGALVTDGGLAFYGDLQGNFRAVDRKTGKVLWERRLGSGIIGNPITYKVGGKQYVSVWSGIGGWIGLPVTAGLDLSDKFGAIGATAMTKAANLDKIPMGGTLYTFGFDSGSNPVITEELLDNRPTYNVTSPDIERRPYNEGFALFVKPGRAVDLSFWIGSPAPSSLSPDARPIPKVLAAVEPLDAEFQCFICKDQTVQTRPLGKITNGTSQRRAQFSFTPDLETASHLAREKRTLAITVSQHGVPIDRLILPINLSDATTSLGAPLPAPKPRNSSSAQNLVGRGVDIEIDVANKDDDICFTLLPRSNRLQSLLGRAPMRLMTGLKVAAVSQLIKGTFTQLNLIVEAGGSSKPDLQALYERWRKSTPASGATAKLSSVEQAELLSALALVGRSLYTRLVTMGEPKLAEAFRTIEGQMRNQRDGSEPISLLFRNSTGAYIPWQLLYFKSLADDGSDAREDGFLGLSAEISEDLTRQAVYRPELSDASSPGTTVVLGTWQGNNPRSNDTAAVYARQLVQAFGTWYPGVNITATSSRAELLRLMDERAGNLHLFAVYAHGAATGDLGIPEILLEATEIITPDDIANRAGNWSISHQSDIGEYFRRGPVIVLDACETNGGPDGSGQTGFAASFLRIGAGAVVSTEASVWAPYAFEFGHDLIKHLHDGLDVSGAVFATRREHWSSLNNPLGLLYSLRGMPNAKVNP